MNIKQMEKELANKRNEIAELENLIEIEKRKREYEKQFDGVILGMFVDEIRYNHVLYNNPILKGKIKTLPEASMTYKIIFERKGRKIKCTLYNMETNKEYKGVSSCHEEDTFSYVTGMEIARHRALTKYHEDCINRLGM